MLDKTQHDNGVVTFRSPRLAAVGVSHGFSTRVGGISPEPYASLNLDILRKGPESDANTTVAENFRRLRAALGLERYKRVEAPQVHGAEVWDAPAKPVRFADAPRCDALVTSHAQQMLTCRTADCVPVLLASGDGRVVAAAHAGWRGVVAGVVPAAVRRMREAHRVEHLVAAIGPCIGVEYFEVGPEVAEAFEGAGLSQAVHPGPDDRSMIDLQAATRQQLEQAGVHQIDGHACCTYRDADLFYSHRRDTTHQGHKTGRMAAVIAARPG